MTLQATVSMGWVNTVLATARTQGVDSGMMLATAGIPDSALGWERWPIDYITRLWQAAERCTGDTGFGLKVGRGVSPASVNVVGFALQSAPTLRDAIMMVQKYQRLISDGGRFQMLAGHASTWVVYHPRQGQLAFSPHQIEAVLAAVVSFGIWLTGASLRPLRVQFSQSQLGAVSGYRDIFACPVDFEQAFNGLLLDNVTLDQPLPQANAELAQVHEQFIAARLATLDPGTVSAEDLRQWLLARMGPQIPRRAQAAQAIGVSERTLARRLAEQGHTFERLLDEVRRELALLAVADRKRPLSDIALALGFAELSPFYRAFQRWTGSPPSRWRGELKR